jgi:hypothetical protein
MTSAQWLFEYMSLREKEKEQTDTLIQTLRVLKHMLITILGLNLGQKKKDGDEEKKDEDEEGFIPLSLVAGRREVVEHLLEQMQSEEVAQVAIDDNEFEKMSAAIAHGEDLGDMSPLFEVDEDLNKTLNTWFTPGREQELQRLGVKIFEEKEDDVNHVSVDAEEINKKRIKKAIETRQAGEQVKEQIREEKKNLKSRGVKVTFDDA